MKYFGNIARRGSIQKDIPDENLLEKRERKANAKTDEYHTEGNQTLMIEGREEPWLPTFGSDTGDRLNFTETAKAGRQTYILLV